MDNWVIRLIGGILIALGVLGMLSLLGESNPLGFISNVLVGFTNQIVSESASIILWFMFLLLGFTLVGPSQGYTKKIVEMRR